MVVENIIFRRRATMLIKILIYDWRETAGVRFVQEAEVGVIVISPETKFFRLFNENHVQSTACNKHTVAVHYKSNN